LLSNISTKEFDLSNIFECEYLKVSKIECRKNLSLMCTEDSFYSLLIISGNGQIHYKGKVYEYTSGDSFFLPAGMGKIELHGEFTALLSSI